MKTTSIRLGMAICLVTASATLSRAGFISPSTWTRPTDDASATLGLTTYQEWDAFTSPTGPNLPDIAEINPSGIADALDAAAPGSGAFITSGGNIYSFSGVIEPRAVVPGYAYPGGTTNFLVQIESNGSDIDPADLTLNGTLVSALDGYSYTELSRTSLGGTGGSMVEHAWMFAAPTDLSSFQLDWGWGPTSSSLGRMSVDTQVMPVPEPASITLALASVAGLVFARRRLGATRK